MIKQIIALFKSPKCHHCKHREIVHYDNDGSEGCNVCVECIRFETKEDILEREQQVKSFIENPTHIFITQEMITLLEKPLTVSRPDKDRSTSETIRIKRYNKL